MPGAEHLDERPALEAPNRALLTVGVMMAMIVVMLDTTVANVALPHMQASMLFLPEGPRVPAVGDEIEVRVRFTTTTFDRVVTG